MPRSVPEWIGKTPDTRIPDRVRLRVFDRYNGVCQLSKQKILPGDKWEISHRKGLFEGGENRESNLEPVLVKPHKKETARQMAMKKKTNRLKAKHYGIEKPKKKIKSAGFAKVEKQPITSYEPLPPKQIYR